MAFEQTFFGISLHVVETTLPGEQPELIYRFTNTANEAWTLARIKGFPQAGFGGHLVIETNAGDGVPGDTTTERLRIDQNGNIGLGKLPDASYRLDVNGIINATDIHKNGAPLRVSQWDDVSGGINYAGGNVGIGTTTPAGKLTVQSPAHINVIFDQTGTQDHMTLTVGSAGTGIHFGNSNRFFISADPYSERTTTGFGNEVFTILPSGNVGIRANAPQVPLHILGGTDASPTGGGYLVVGSTSGPNLVLDENEIIARNNRQPSGLHVQAAGGNFLIHSQAPGRVGIGTANPNFTLDVRGTIGSNTTLYHSDIRWKKNVEDIPQALDKILQLRGVKYEWRSEEYAEMRFDQGTHIGVIGQEVEKVIPEVVHMDENGYKTVEYSNIIAVCIEAIKALNAENNALKQRLQTLETRLEVPI